MIKSKDFEYHRMDVVVREMTKSLTKQEWSLAMLQPQHNSANFAYTHLLVLQHSGYPYDFLISSNPLHFHVDMNTVFDVVDEIPPERFLSKVFSNAQKETLYYVLNQSYRLSEYITDYANDNGLMLRPFKSTYQSELYEFMMRDKMHKHPTLSKI